MRTRGRDAFPYGLGFGCSGLAFSDGVEGGACLW